jgi:glycine cleavage system H protein
MVPENLYYTKEHEWVLIQNGIARIGITDYAQKQLGDVVYIELPAQESQLKQMTSCGVIESVKAVSEIYSPLSGKVKAANSALADHPEKINHAPYGEGWMFEMEEIQENELKNLLSAKSYQKLIGSES